MESAVLRHRYAVVVYGRRDHYQVQLALHEAGALDRVFTDFYASDWMISLASRTSKSLEQRLRVRSHPQLSARYFAGDWPKKEFVFRYLGWRGKTVSERYAVLERLLSERAARYAIHHPDIGVVCYSYYWQALAEARAAKLWHGPAVVFQVHPVPSHVREVLATDRANTGLSYLPEPEELAPTDDDQRYLASLAYADGVIAASSFTASGLKEAGVPANKVRVVPYGFGALQSPLDSPDSEARWEQQKPLRLLWVGQLAYRKGPHHLFDAVRRFSPEDVQLSLVTRSTLPAELATSLPPNVTIYNSVTDKERQVMYNTHHLFVLPSLVEGFGLVYLEALAEGLPVLGTTNTGVLDIIDSETQGFVVAPGDSDAIAEVFERCIRVPSLLPTMSKAARKSSVRWTWAEFRRGVQESLVLFEGQPWAE